MQYQHTQPGWVIRLTCLICLCIPLGLSLAFNQGRLPLYEMLPVGAIMLAVVTFFHSLTVRIDSESMRVKFGVGLVAYNFLLKDTAEMLDLKGMSMGARVQNWSDMVELGVWELPALGRLVMCGDQGSVRH